MTGYVVQRLGAVLLILVAMSVLVFLATHALPSNTAALILGQYSTPETQAALGAQARPRSAAAGAILALGQPVAARRHGAVAGDGTAGRADAVGRVRPLGDPGGRQRWPSSRSLGSALGVVAAVWRGRWPDHAASVFAYLGISVPEFYWGLVLILVFGSTFHLLPTSGCRRACPMGLAPLSRIWYCRWSTLTLTLLAHVARLTRSSMVEELDSMYVKVARARGLPERMVILRHALRNALLPTITVLAQDFGFLIGGIVAVETIFAYPGLGRLLIFSLERQDLPLMQAAILVLTAVYCLANLGADLLYGVVNPRIRYGGSVD